MNVVVYVRGDVMNDIYEVLLVGEREHDAIPVEADLIDDGVVVVTYSVNVAKTYIELSREAYERVVREVAKKLNKSVDEVDEGDIVDYIIEKYNLKDKFMYSSHVLIL